MDYIHIVRSENVEAKVAQNVRIASEESGRTIAKNILSNSSIEDLLETKRTACSQIRKI